jgi:hypothetical protein
MKQVLIAMLALLVCVGTKVQAQTPQTTPNTAQNSVAVAGGEKPRIYVTDSDSWSVSSGAGGDGSGFGASSSGGARPQTAEIVKTFNERCPQVLVNDRLAASNYVVELDHEGGKSFWAHKDKVAVFVQQTGNSIYSKSTLSVGNSVQGACQAILAHWATHAKKLIAAAATAQPESTVSNAPVKTKLTITSNPSGADIEINGAFVGDTPSTIDVSAGMQQIVVSRSGYAAWTRNLKTTGGTVTLNADLTASK